MGKRVILGLTAEVTLFDSQGKEKKVLARIDTGATASSIDEKLAQHLNIGPVTHTKVVKSASGTRKRPIVHSKLKLNGDIIEAYFTLADRSHMTYQVLIGQNILKKGNFLIDPKKTIHLEKILSLEKKIHPEKETKTHPEKKNTKQQNDNSIHIS